MCVDNDAHIVATPSQAYILQHGALYVLPFVEASSLRHGGADAVCSTCSKLYSNKRVCVLQ